MSRITKRPAAVQDLVDRYVYFFENASEALAERFLAAAESSFAELGHKPLIGSPVRLRHKALHGLRKWAVKGFDHVLVFYWPRESGVTIVRVLHSSQDWAEALRADR